METLFNALFIPYLFDWSRAQGNNQIKWSKIKDESQSECIRSLDSRPIRILTNTRNAGTLGTSRC